MKKITLLLILAISCLSSFAADRYHHEKEERRDDRYGFSRNYNDYRYNKHYTPVSRYESESRFHGNFHRR